MVVDAIPRIVGFVYAIVLAPALILLWRSGRITRRRALPLLAVSAVLGFLIFAPMAPYQLQLLVAGDLAGLDAPVALVLGGLAFFVVVALVGGRTFCGHLCPVGAVQEILSLAGYARVGRTRKKETIVLRSVVFAAVLLAGLLFSENILGALGLEDFFFLNVTSVSFFVFAALMILGVAVYRPFCRVICPYGAVLALAAAQAQYRFRRTDLCIKCRKCEKACPVDEAKESDRKVECYMCGRCVEVCPVEGALRYARR
ncbi:4Fe-4S binding protein [Methanofollis aquaemaris]|uniref:4Fe-4S binding protein n=1 Tax=Methanofollis aquaemaris TaxID=126734 RepID=A0A8A3S5L6_9EURY|nr:4Fe-4S binding protein [Methanofollis aquaemaris]QSZ66916.1 4Fe-4S binding protein [Methanofollis aquaemaris]